MSGRLRENWRIILLAVMVLLSTIAIFGPVGGDQTVPGANTANQTDDPTNLQFGLDLSGGTRIRAPLIGITAEDVELQDMENEEVRALERNLTTELSVSTQELTVRTSANESNTVEVFSNNITNAQLRQALDEQGVGHGEIRDGVTDQTLTETERTLDDKISGAGLSGGDAYISRSATGGEAFIVVEVPNMPREAVKELINEQGTVLVVAHFPQNGSYRNVPMFSQEGIAHVGTMKRGETGEPNVPVDLTPRAGDNFTNAMNTFGFTSPQGTTNCTYQSNPDDAGHCIYTVSNGKVVNDTIVEGTIVQGAGLNPGLANTIRNGDFQNAFQVETSNASEAQRLALNMRAGALPTNLDLDAGTTSYIEPSLAQRFKSLSVVTGLLAMLSVGAVVGWRYRKPKIAIPMVLTAAAEVYLLLGFASIVGMALDLSHIAGFIAVIGTGVDDLVIIADEILQQGDVSTNKVFRSRFRKAFWVIGAAAATTVIAMAPLAVLSLGDLQGFAIITIVGVLIGVLVTRPAYGDVIRNLVMD